MRSSHTLALIHPEQPVAVVFMALTFTAVIIIPAVFLLGFLREKMAAKISRKST